MQFGDEFSNPWASADNPQKVGYFVRKGRKPSGINKGAFYEFTDKRGKFWRMAERDVLRALSGDSHALWRMRE